ncbi:MAG: formate dehydrogenase accessory sulfurtransferase FdhD [Gemmatimonadota bacterium]
MNGPMVEERIVRLVHNGETLYEWRCTPADLEAMAAGRLYAEGFTPSPDRLPNYDRMADPIIVSLTAPPAIAATSRPRPKGSQLPTSDQFTELYRALFAGVDARHEHGGMHAAALARDGNIAYQAEDVGRHNAVDKAIGMAVLDGADLTQFGMLISSRVSGEIARKAAKSGIAWLASRSIPTSLAVAIARGAGMPIIGRAAGRKAYVY